MSDRIRVGLVGANPGRGWAQMAHVPALLSLNDFAITAVATRHMATAQRTAESLGGALAFDDYHALVRHPDVDLVSICVKVPAHFDIVVAAIEAGKHVFCEWPLTTSFAQSQQLLALAQARGVRHAIGLQGRFAPAVVHLRDLLQQGYLGKPISCSIVGSGLAWGSVIDEANSYLLDAANTATMLTIPVGHLLDTLASVFGSVEPQAAILTTVRREVTVYETGQQLPMTAPDDVRILATLGEGIPTSIHYRGGTSRATNFRWEINGSEGDIVITAPTGHIQMADLCLQGARASETAMTTLVTPSPHEMGSDLPAMPASVARMYARLAADIRTGANSLAPGFDAALACHTMIDKISALAAAPTIK